MFCETSLIAQHYPINLTQICPKASSTLGLLDPCRIRGNATMWRGTNLHCHAWRPRWVNREPAQKASYVAKAPNSTVRRSSTRVEGISFGGSTEGDGSIPRLWKLQNSCSVPINEPHLGIDCSLPNLAHVSMIPYLQPCLSISRTANLWNSMVPHVYLDTNSGRKPRLKLKMKKRKPKPKLNILALGLISSIPLIIFPESL